MSTELRKLPYISTRKEELGVWSLVDGRRVNLGVRDKHRLPQEVQGLNLRTAVST